MVCSFSGLTSRNPLEAGQKFNSYLFFQRCRIFQVAIPLKRGKSSTPHTSRCGSFHTSRNPLEAGQKFNHHRHRDKASARRRNPLEAGQKFNWHNLPTIGGSGVAIPLKRGKSSTLNQEFALHTMHCRNPLEAGQKFNRKLKSFCGRQRSRNPLEAGQKFNSLCSSGVEPSFVAIPLKRGKSST